MIGAIIYGIVIIIIIMALIVLAIIPERNFIENIPFIMLGILSISLILSKGIIDNENKISAYDGIHYCTDCGEDLSNNKCCKNKTTVNSGYCTDCGAEINNSHNFCSGCGKDLKK